MQTGLVRLSQQELLGWPRDRRVSACGCCVRVVHVCPAGDEVTYDYRFASDDKLRCNCGASTCRGFVNAPSTGPESPKRRAGGAGVLLLPRGEVEILRGEAAAAALAGMAFPAMQQLPHM